MVITLHKEEYLAFLKNKYVTGWVADPKCVNTAGGRLFLSENLRIGIIFLLKENIITEEK